MSSASPARTVYSALRYLRSMGIREAPVDGEADGADGGREHRALRLQAAAEKAACPSCPLKDGPRGRWEGDPYALLAFVVDAPGPGGELLPGEEGTLFANMLKKMGMARTEVFLVPAVLCPVPVGGPPPAPALAACRARLVAELEAVSPSAICTMGSLASAALLGGNEPIARLRGRRHDWGGRAVFPTLPPRIMLQNTATRKDVWQDMLAILEHLGKTPGERPPCRN